MNAASPRCMCAHGAWCCVPFAAGRHHDNYTIKHTRAKLQGLAGPEGSTHAGQENSQRIGSEVLLYTESMYTDGPLDHRTCAA
jgi:hypothetical protein